MSARRARCDRRVRSSAGSDRTRRAAGVRVSVRGVGSEGVAATLAFCGLKGRWEERIDDDGEPGADGEDDADEENDVLKPLRARRRLR